MAFIIQLLESTLSKVLGAFAHNWYYLLASILVGSLIKLYLDKDRVAAYLQHHQKGGVALATAAAVGTPLCSCGTTAVVIGMMASMMPWAPIVAFMVASPLSSPEGTFYTAGLFGWPFALAVFIGSILLGLGGGLAAGLLDKAGWLKGQARLAAPQPINPVIATSPAPIQTSCCQVPQLAVVPVMAASTGCGCQSIPAVPAIPVKNTCGCQSAPTAKPKVTLGRIASQLMEDGPRLLVLFTSFVFLGYLLNGLIPAGWISSLFGSGHAYSVPLAATLGLPFYINGEASLPMVRAMLDSGMSQGAALAFLISGAGTSIGAVAGALTIARWRVVAVVVATLWLGAMALGITFDLLLAARII